MTSTAKKVIENFPDEYKEYLKVKEMKKKAKEFNL